MDNYKPKERPLAYYGHPVLRQKAKDIEEITDEHRQLVQDMLVTMKKHSGMGLAAPQVHESIRLFVVTFPVDERNGDVRYEAPKVYINPVLSQPGEDSWVAEEGCLSIPGIRGEVERPDRIRVRALDLDGNQFEEELEGWPARLIMHENDHLNGVLFPDRMSPRDRKQMEPYLKGLKKRFKK